MSRAAQNAAAGSFRPLRHMFSIAALAAVALAPIVARGSECPGVQIDGTIKVILTQVLLLLLRILLPLLLLLLLLSLSPLPLAVVVMMALMAVGLRI